MAVPLTTIHREDESSDIEQVLALAQEYEAEDIAVGLPLSLSGGAGLQAERTAQFAEELDGRSRIPVNVVDERYTSVEAERLLRESGVKPSREKTRVDAAAAAVILQSYLDSKRVGS